MNRSRMVFFVALLIALPATTFGASHLQCFYNGKAYPEGARVGETVCRDGTWVQQ